ncbi:hypothetical protein CRG98_023811 [Punica granatum]|nr:hypothetical protein CRG98_023811 [Punica granatum]
MEIEVLSKDYVKPLTPTPSHLRTYKFSLFDQLVPSAHIPIVVFYDRPTAFSTKEAMRRLKSSVSEALPDFYPFAGRIMDNLYIDCNDAGIYYVEAKVNCSVRELIGKPDIQLTRKLLPAEPDDSSSEGGTHIAMVQVNEFACGGIALAAYLSHKIIDGPTLVTLLKAWSHTARGHPQEVKPSFIRPTIFPQCDKLSPDYILGIWPSALKVGKCVTRRFVFSAEAVATIKARAASPSFVAHPTRIESVSAFIWKCCMRVTEAKEGSRKPSILSHVINLRGKANDESPIPEHTIGNLLWVMTARSDQEADRELQSLVGVLRAGFLGINIELFEQFAGENGASKMQECLDAMSKVYEDEETDYFGFSSLVNMGTYETDFGWGKPMWVSPGGIDGEIYQNLVFLIDTRKKGGIEAWTTLGEQDMALLEADQELLSLASLESSPLELM